MVAKIGEPGAQTSAAAPAAAPAAASAPAVASAPVAPVSAGIAPPAGDRPKSEMTASELRRVRSTPVVRKIAAEHNINIAFVPDKQGPRNSALGDILESTDYFDEIRQRGTGYRLTVSVGFNLRAQD